MSVFVNWTILQWLGACLITYLRYPLFYGNYDYHNFNTAPWMVFLWQSESLSPLFPQNQNSCTFICLLIKALLFIIHISISPSVYNMNISNSFSFFHFNGCCYRPWTCRLGHPQAVIDWKSSNYKLRIMKRCTKYPFRIA